jgi:hypothetical protein
MQRGFIQGGSFHSRLFFENSYTSTPHARATLAMKSQEASLCARTGGPWTDAVVPSTVYFLQFFAASSN